MIIAFEVILAVVLIAGLLLAITITADGDTKVTIQDDSENWPRL